MVILKEMVINILIDLLELFNNYLIIAIKFNFRWGRWPEMLEVGQFKRSWRSVEVEECSRIIVSLLVCIPI